MVTKEPKTLRGMVRKAETGDGRKSTVVEKMVKQEEKTLKQFDKAAKGKSPKRKK
jgi:hypothetical protein